MYKTMREARIGTALIMEDRLIKGPSPMLLNKFKRRVKKLAKKYPNDLHVQRFIALASEHA